MKIPNRNSKKLFYVVQFKELPSHNIDDYVCVPHCWIIHQMQDEQKAIFAYPDNEASSVTRNRVKKREKLNEEWKYYLAIIKHESETYNEAVDWIEARTNHEDGDEEEKTPAIKTNQPELVVNRQLRSSGTSRWLDSKADKPQLVVEPFGKSRKPLPRILIRRSLPLRPWKENLDTKQLKPDETAEPAIAVSSESTELGNLEQKHQIMIMENRLIQNAQTKIVVAINSESSTKQGNQPGLSKEDQPVDASVQFTAPKIPDKRQPSPVGQDCEQPPSPPSVDYDGLDVDVEADEEVQPESVVEERPSTSKTPMDTSEQSSQPYPVLTRLNPLVYHANSLPKKIVHGIPVRQSIEVNDIQHLQLHQLLTASTTVLRPPIRANQPRSPILPGSSAPSSKPQLQPADARNSTVTHSCQIAHLQGFVESIPSATHDTLSPLDLSSKRHKPITRRKSLSISKKPVNKKTRLGSITKKISAMQYPPNSVMQLNLPSGLVTLRAAPPTQKHLQQPFPLNHTGSNVGGNVVDQRLPLNGMVITSAAQNLSNLAHQSRSFDKPPHKQQYFPNQKQYSQHVAQEMFRRRNMPPSIDQRTYLQNAMMSRGHISQNQPNHIHQPPQFLPQQGHQRLPVNVDYMQALMRYEMLKGSIDGAICTPAAQNGVANFQSAAQNPSFVPIQPPVSFENSQNGLHTLNYRDPRTASIQIGLPVESNSNSRIPKPQEVTTEIRSPAVLETLNHPLSHGLRHYSIQDPRILAKLSQTPTVHHEIYAAAVPENITVQTEPTTQDSEAQTTMSFDQLQETQFLLVPEGNVYQHSHTTNPVVNQAIGTDITMDVLHCEDKIAVVRNRSEMMDSECQTDEYFMEEQELPHQGEVPDPEIVSDHDMVSDHEDILDDQVSSDGSLVDAMNEGHASEECASPANIEEETPTTVQCPTPERQQEVPRMAKQKTMDIHKVLLSEMYKNLTYTQDVHNNLRNSVLVISQLYEKLLGKDEEVEPTESFQIPTCNVASEVPQVAKVTPVGVSEQENPGNADPKKNSSISTAPSTSRRKYTFVLPPEYDPNDSRWTLKHRKSGSRLIELMPQSRIYVGKTGFKKVIEASNDCRSLARLMLTEVFSKNALSVCSLTGGKARAFKSLDIDVRPGLDEHARLVLLAFIEEYGNKRKWNTADSAGIISSIRTKIQEIRVKFGKKKISLSDKMYYCVTSYGSLFVQML